MPFLPPNQQCQSTEGMELFLLTHQNPSMFLFFKLSFVGLRLQLLNVYDFGVLSALIGMPLGLQHNSAICIMVLSGC